MSSTTCQPWGPSVPCEGCQEVEAKVGHFVHLFSAFLSKEACTIFESYGALRVSLGLQLHARYRRFQSVALPLQDLRGQTKHNGKRPSYSLHGSNLEPTSCLLHPAFVCNASLLLPQFSTSLKRYRITAVSRPPGI